MNKIWIPIIAAMFAISGCTKDASSKDAVALSKPITDIAKKQDLVGYAFFDGKIVIPDSARGMAYSPYDGSVTSVSTALGKHVGRGETIVRLAIPGAEEAAAMAKANASAAKESYSSEKATVSGPVEDAKRVLAEAREAERLAKETQDAGGAADVASATQARIEAESALRQAQLQVNEAMRPSTMVLNQSVAELRAAQADAAKGIVRAPLTGTVVALEAKPGLAAIQKQLLATIINYDAVRVQGIVPPELKDLVVKGSRVIVSLEGPNSDPFDGRVLDVTVIPPTNGQKSAGYLANIAFSNPRNITFPDPVVKRVGVKTGEVKDALVVPIGAVVTKNGRSTVFVQAGDNWTETDVQTGISDGALVEIKSGLTEGAVVRVVVQGRSSL